MPYKPLTASEPQPRKGYVSITSGQAPKATAPIDTGPKYFQDKTLGASSLKDASGRPFLTFSDEKKKASVLDKNRVATTFDPRVPQKLTREVLSNGRIPSSVSQAIREELGALHDEQLDH